MHRQGRFFKCSISCTPLIYDLPVFSLVNLHLRWTASAPAFLQTRFLILFTQVLRFPSADLEPALGSGINEPSPFSQVLR